MLTFQPLELSHLEPLAPYFTRNPSRLCDFSVGATFLWRTFYNIHFALERDVLYFCTYAYPHESGEVLFSPPLGGGKAAYLRLRDYCESYALPLRFAAVAQELLPVITALFPGSEVTQNRDWCDYLYNSAELRDLAGRRFAGQRNHIHRFLAACPDWRFEAINAGNLPEVRRFLDRFHDRLGQDTPALREEYEKTLELFTHYERYGQLGGVLFAAGQAVGFSVGEVVNDTLIVHIEKANRDIPGAYPMLVNQFAKHYAADVPYINREEDLGEPGLRASKLSYHPVDLLWKYYVTVV